MTTKKENKVELFYKYYSVLFSTGSITNLSTGETHSITPTDTILYMYFIDQFKSYSSQGLQFFESIESIAAKTSHAKSRTINQFLKKFSALGLIEYSKSCKGGKFQSNIYTLVLTPEEAEGIVSFNMVCSEQNDEPVKAATNTESRKPTLLGKEVQTKEKKYVQYFSPELDDDEQSTNVEIIKPAWIPPKVHPWGDVPIFTSNGQFSYEAKSWAESGNTSEEAIDKMKKYRKEIGDPNWNNYITFQYSDSDEEGLPF